MTKKVITVLLIDDHPVIHTGYRRLLESMPEFRVVADADNGETGCMLYELHHPDVVIVDLNMPGIGGLETIRRIKAKNPAANILVFSMDTNKVIVQRSLDMGAIGYLTKQSDSSQLSQAIRLVSRRQPYIDPKLAQGLFNEEAHNSLIKNPLQALSKREFQLFQLFAEGRSCVQIAEIISISPKTVGVHHANIMKKLNLKNTAQLVHMAIEHDIIRS